MSTLTETAVSFFFFLSNTGSNAEIIQKAEILLTACFFPPSNYHYSKRGFAVSRPALMVLACQLQIVSLAQQASLHGAFGVRVGGRSHWGEPSAGACHPGCSWDLKA